MTDLKLELSEAGTIPGDARMAGLSLPIILSVVTRTSVFWQSRSESNAAPVAVTCRQRDSVSRLGAPVTAGPAMAPESRRKVQLEMRRTWTIMIMMAARAGPGPGVTVAVCDSCRGRGRRGQRPT